MEELFSFFFNGICSKKAGADTDVSIVTPFFIFKFTDMKTAPCVSGMLRVLLSLLSTSSAQLMCSIPTVTPATTLPTQTMILTCSRRRNGLLSGRWDLGRRKWPTDHTDFFFLFDWQHFSLTACRPSFLLSVCKQTHWSTFWIRGHRRVYAQPFLQINSLNLRFGIQWTEVGNPLTLAEEVSWVAAPSLLSWTRLSCTADGICLRSGDGPVPLGPVERRPGIVFDQLQGWKHSPLTHTESRSRFSNSTSVAWFSPSGFFQVLFFEANTPLCCCLTLKDLQYDSDLQACFLQRITF